MKKLLAAITFALFASSLFVVGGPASAGSSQTSFDDLLVVTANLHEAYDKTDACSRFGDMQIFVNRVTGNSVIPTFAPDVLLLQEVRGCSLSKIVNLLNAALPGENYGLPVSRPERPAFRYGDRRILNYDTGIIINRKTVGRAKNGDNWTPAGHFRTSYAWADRATSKRVAVRTQQFVLIQRRDGNGKLTGAKIPLVSLHLTRRVDLKPRRRDYYEGLWARQISNGLNDKFNAFNPDYKVIGGDINRMRCDVGTSGGGCPWAPWYKHLRNEKGYKDALFHCTGCEFPKSYSLGVDYILHTGADAKIAGKDIEGRTTTSNTYSDHIFRWAHLTDSS